MTRSTLRTLLTALVVGSVLFAGTAVAADDIAGGGAGDGGELGGAPPVDPGTVTGGNSTANHVLTFTVENVSMDGNTDRINVSVPNAIAEAGLGINGASVENASSGAGVSISSSPSLVDGSDGDELQDTVRLAVSPDGSGSVSLNVRLDLSTTAPTVESEQQYGFVATVQDSDGSTAGPTEFATLTVVPENRTADDDSGDETTDGGSTDTSDDQTTTETDGDDSTDGGESTDTGGEQTTDESTDAGTDTTDDSTATEGDQTTETDDGDQTTETDDGDQTTETAVGETAATDGDATTTGTGPGFGAVGALAALIGSLALARRRA